VKRGRGMKQCVEESGECGWREKATVSVEVIECWEDGRRIQVQQGSKTEGVAVLRARCLVRLACSGNEAAARARRANEDACVLSWIVSPAGFQIRG
jgi:hypothetical protein